MKTPHPEIVQAITVTAEIYGRNFSTYAAQAFAADLAAFPPDSVLAALSRCRRELRSFPSIADIISRIDDGRPGVEEAFAMLPKDEDTTVVWTAEMRKAFGLVRHLIVEDPIAARMAFKEAYTRLTSDARNCRVPVQWEASLGHYKEGRAGVLREAVKDGKISNGYARQLLADAASPAAPAKQLSGPVDQSTPAPFDFKGLIARIKANAEGQKQS